jgi:hypothetical protein
LSALCLEKLLFWPMRLPIAIQFNVNAASLVQLTKPRLEAINAAAARVLTPSFR